MHQRTSPTHPDHNAADLPVLERIRARVRGFNSDESGQSIVYLVLMMFLLACFTFMVINSGALLHDKMQAQSAADSAVLSGSTWIARGMNLNSMMNIFMALCMAEAIYMKAVYWTALSGILLQAVIESFWIGVCLTTGNCAPAVEVPFEDVALWGVLADADDSEDFMWDVMETLTPIEANVDVGFAGAAALESSRMARLNGAGFGIMYPPTLPEEEGDLQDLCECVLDGS
ncbi:MAG: Tad domain-containing protein, partial [Myxococcota bacterium]|nr:Tad domain-containing protein [Myxococcota bacterium]